MTVTLTDLDDTFVSFTAIWVGRGDKVATVVDATSQRGSRLRLPDVLVDRCGVTWNLLFTRHTDVSFCDLMLWYECSCGVSVTPWQRCVALRVRGLARTPCTASPVATAMLNTAMIYDVMSLFATPSQISRVPVLEHIHHWPCWHCAPIPLL